MRALIIIAGTIAAGSFAACGGSNSKSETKGETKGEAKSDSPGEYAKKSKMSEAEMNLESIKKGLKMYDAEQGGFPKGSAPLTPATPCCDGPNHKCAPSPGDWSGAVWTTIDFDVVEPSYFQYSYESTDGQVAVVKAVGDLDCDTTTITYELRCELPSGVACTLTKPANAD